MTAKRCRCCISWRINKTTPILLSKLFTTCPQLEGLRPKTVKQFRSSDLLFSIAFVMHLFFWECRCCIKAILYLQKRFCWNKQPKVEIQFNVQSRFNLEWDWYSKKSIGLNHWKITLDCTKSETFVSHFQPVLHFYTPWKHRKPLIFDVLKGCRSVTVKNEIVKFLLVTLLKRTLRIINFCHKS